MRNLDKVIAVANHLIDEMSGEELRSYVFDMTVDYIDKEWSVERVDKAYAALMQREADLEQQHEEMENWFI